MNDAMIRGTTSEATATVLDASYIDRAAPPGSLRYFSLLYTPADRRDALAALFVIDAEIRESAHNTSHDVAHTRLQWWRGEVDRLVNGVPQHPAARALHATSAAHGLDFSLLHELLVAADMDLARLTYTNAAELEVYARRSGGIPLQLAAGALLTSARLNERTHQAITEIGSALRRCELLLDLPQEARRGRIYVSLDELEAHGLTPADVPSSPPALRPLLAAHERTTRQQLLAGIDAIASAERPQLRPILVLAALHLRCLDRFARCGYKHEPRIDLKPLERVWVAWRAARRAG